MGARILNQLFAILFAAIVVAYKGPDKCGSYEGLYRYGIVCNYLNFEYNSHGIATRKINDTVSVPGVNWFKAAKAFTGRVYTVEEALSLFKCNMDDTEMQRMVAPLYQGTNPSQPLDRRTVSFFHELETDGVKANVFLAVYDHGQDGMPVMGFSNYWMVGELEDQDHWTCDCRDDMFPHSREQWPI